MYFTATVELLFSGALKDGVLLSLSSIMQWWAKKGTIDHTMEYIVSKFVSVHLALVVNCQINTSDKR